jgi:benzoylformate decarboxylase/acetolactate synthase-1/2/3 large subunit
MAALVHDVVGLLHASLGLFYARVDRCPILVLGGAGPMDTTRRRPEIDWIHTANVQGNAIRDFVKWDDQPASIAAIPDSLRRAFRLAMGEPAGPTYLAIDADLQEQRTNLTSSIADELDAASGALYPDPQLLRTAARALVDARNPVIVAGYSGRDPNAFESVSQLAHDLAARLIDTGIRLNAPNMHPMNATGTKVPDEADLILFIDVKDLRGPISSIDQRTRNTSHLAANARMIDIGFGDLHASSWVVHQGAHVTPNIRIPADAIAAMPALLSMVRSELDVEPQAERESRGLRRSAIAAEHIDTRERWAREAAGHANDRPIAPSWLAAEVWSVIRDYDWVLAAGTMNGWAMRLWDMDQAYRHPGKSLGTATQIGITLGVGLAHRETDRIVVGLQPDGDLLYDSSALWVAAKYGLPLLIVMYNNRAYYNDWHHQIQIASERGHPTTRAALGNEIDKPAVDFAKLARSFGLWAEGPIEAPTDVRESVRRAAQFVASQRQPALVDVVCAHR